ncbi:MAG: hypothetical protein ACLGI9_12835, partial [Thermoanaerobaculia bacterium]
TTNKRRDSWFAGFAREPATVVWVGYDDNARTRLSGARAALPIWARFTAAVRPPRGYMPFSPPGGIVTQTVDPTTGQIATEACPFKVKEFFAEWQSPTEPCSRHRPGYGQYASYGEVPIDPVTGQPLYDYQVYQNDEGRIEISNYGYGYGQEPPQDAVPGAEIGALPYADEPLTDDLEAEPLPGGEWDEDETEVEESEIVIRPAQPRPEPVQTPQETPAEATPEASPAEAETAPEEQEEPTPPPLLAAPEATAEPEATPPPP